MSSDKEAEFEKRVDDIRSIRAILAEGKDTPLIYPWAFIAWALLVGTATAVHLLLALGPGIERKAALLLIWLPVFVAGAGIESLSFVIRARRDHLPLFNHRLGTAILGSLATITIVTTILVRLAPLDLTPGITVLLGSIALVFYAQVSWSRLFIETWITIVIGLILEISGLTSVIAWGFAGFYLALIYFLSGIHAHLIEKGGRG
jgi:hypothetical protein